MRFSSGVLNLNGSSAEAPHMVQALSRQAAKMRIVSKEDLYKSEIQRAIHTYGRGSLNYGEALLNLAELYDENNQERDSEPIWREIEKILATQVKAGLLDRQPR